MNTDEQNFTLTVDPSAPPEYKRITLDEVATMIKGLLADKGVEAVVLTVPLGQMKITRTSPLLEAIRYPEGPITVEISEVKPNES